MSLRKLYLLLGSNMNERQTYISTACDEIVTKMGPIIEKSQLYESEAWGKTDQSAFLNQAICVESDEDPEEILINCKTIERNVGRQHRDKWHEREIDIDILIYGDLIVDKPALNIPHKRLIHRRFALKPLSEIAGNVIHPDIGLTINQLCELCVDTGKVEVVNLG